MYKIDSIIISNELNKEQGNVAVEDFADVVVQLKNGDVYTASFYSFEAINELQYIHAIEGSFLQGRYFWANNLILVVECTREQIELTIQDLIQEGDFVLAFNHR